MDCSQVYWHVIKHNGCLLTCFFTRAVKVMWEQLRFSGLQTYLLPASSPAESEREKKIIARQRNGGEFSYSRGLNLALALVKSHVEYELVRGTETIEARYLHLKVNRPNNMKKGNKGGEYNPQEWIVLIGQWLILQLLHKPLWLPGYVAH